MTMRNIGISLVILILAIFAITLLIQNGQRDPNDHTGEEGNFTPVDPGSISVSLPMAGATVSSRFTIEGEAFGDWFSDGIMNVDLLDNDGNKIWEGEALAEYFTFDDVNDFSAEVDAGEYSGPATIVLKRGDESGDPAYNQTFTVSIIVE